MRTRPSISRATFAAVVLYCLSISGLSHAQNWEFNASADIGVIFTDNLFLESSNEESELVYSIIPTLSLVSEGDRLFGAIEYRPEAYFYDTNSEFDSVADLLDANMTVALIPDTFFLYGSAVNFQSLVAPDGSFPFNNVVVTDNRVDSRVFEVRPYWQQQFGDTSVLTSYRAIRIEYDDELLQTQEAQNVDFNLNNFSAGQGLAWGLNYASQNVEYDNGVEFSYGRAGATLGYWVSRSLRLFVVGGLETPLGDLQNGNLEDDFYEAGFQWVPSTRANVEVAVGKRTFGDSFRLNASYALKRGSTQLSYSQEPATRAGLLFDRRPAQAIDSLDNFGDRAGFDDQFVQKRGQWSANLQFARMTVDFRVFDDRRSSRVAADGTQLGDEAIRGAAIRTSWQLSRKLGLGGGLDYVIREVPPREDDAFGITLDATYALSPRSSLELTVSRRDENNQNNTAIDYVEHQVRLFFRVSLQ